MRDLRQERARPEGVREERLRATTGLLRGLDLTSWRGRSGRRYIVGVHPLTEGELLDRLADSLTRGETYQWSYIDLIVVKNTDASFGPTPEKRGSGGKEWQLFYAAQHSSLQRSGNNPRRTA